MPLRYYPAILERDGDSYGVVFPDLPGCVTTGESAQEAAANAAEVLALHIEGMVEDGDAIPAPSSPDLVPDWIRKVPSEIVAHVLVPVEMPGRNVRLNITMDEGLLHQLDRTAAAMGFTRSGYLAELVRENLRRRNPGAQSHKAVSRPAKRAGRSRAGRRSAPSA
jgi:predicted RNase H-like HicB family nuclease